MYRLIVRLFKLDYSHINLESKYVEVSRSLEMNTIHLKWYNLDYVHTKQSSNSIRLAFASEIICTCKVAGPAVMENCAEDLQIYFLNTVTIHMISSK